MTKPLQPGNPVAAPDGRTGKVYSVVVFNKEVTVKWDDTGYLSDMPVDNLTRVNK